MKRSNEREHETRIRELALPEIVLLERWPVFEDDDATPLHPSSLSEPLPYAPRRAMNPPSSRRLAPPSSVSPISLLPPSSRGRTGGASWGWVLSGALVAIWVMVSVRAGDAPLRAAAERVELAPAALILRRIEAPVVATRLQLGAAEQVMELDAPSSHGAALATPVVAPEPSIPECERLTRAAFAARSAGDLDAATGLYARALRENAGYFPAAIGLADTQWERGDGAPAVASYRQLLSRFPPAMVPERVTQRAGRSDPEEGER